MTGSATGREGRCIRQRAHGRRRGGTGRPPALPLSWVDCVSAPGQRSSPSQVLESENRNWLGGQRAHPGSAGPPPSWRLHWFASASTDGFSNSSADLSRAPASPELTTVDRKVPGVRTHVVIWTQEPLRGQRGLSHGKPAGPLTRTPEKFTPLNWKAHCPSPGELPDPRGLFGE